LNARVIALAAPFVLVALSVAVLPRGLVACNLDNDAGATSDAAAATGTVQDQCSKIGTAFCQREGQCAIPVTLSQCVSDQVAACCTSPSQCNTAAQTPDTYVTACVDDIANLDCNSVANSQLPASCQGIPAKP
jgi:hypothetical protein